MCLGLCVLDEQIVQKHDAREAVSDRVVNRENALAAATRPITQHRYRCQWSGRREADLQEPLGFCSPWCRFLLVIYDFERNRGRRLLEMIPVTLVASTNNRRSQLRVAALKPRERRGKKRRFD